MVVVSNCFEGNWEEVQITDWERMIWFMQMLMISGNASLTRKKWVNFTLLSTMSGLVLVFLLPFISSLYLHLHSYPPFLFRLTTFLSLRKHHPPLPNIVPLCIRLGIFLQLWEMNVEKSISMYIVELRFL